MSDDKITSVDYDSLLTIFVGDDVIRPALNQPNTVGDYTYATDAHAMIIIPNSKLRNRYEAHPKIPNFQIVIDQVALMETRIFKDTDLFKALKGMPKEYERSTCGKCNGNGECDHCGEKCSDCDGEGMVDDESAPKIYSNKKGVIIVVKKMIGAFQMGRIEKVLIEMETEKFNVVGHNTSATMFEIGDIKILLSHLHEDYLDMDEVKKKVELKPIN